MRELLRRIACAALDLEPRREPVTPVEDVVYGVVGGKHPLADEEAAAQRREDAMGLMDDGVMAYVVVRVVREFHGPNAVVDVAVNVADQFWPAVTATLGRLVIAADHAR